MSQINVDGLHYCLLGDCKARVVRCKNISGDIVIPESIIVNNKKYDVTEISTNAFLDNRKLTSVVMPNSIVSIGNYAFRFCSNLTHVTLPNSLKYSGGCMFGDCNSLASIVFPELTKRIGCYMFYDCTSLVSITLNASLEFIGEMAFGRCKNLKHIYCEFDEEPFALGAFLCGPFRRTIYTKNNFIDMVPFGANRRVVRL